MYNDVCVLTITSSFNFTPALSSVTTSLNSMMCVYHKQLRLTSVITGHNYESDLCNYNHNYVVFRHCARVYKDEKDVSSNVEFDLCSNCRVP